MSTNGNERKGARKREGAKIKTDSRGKWGEEEIEEIEKTIEGFCFFSQLLPSPLPCIVVFAPLLLCVFAFFAVS
jgi:hypothetical protein